MKRIATAPASAVPSDLAAKFAALSHPARLEILRYLSVSRANCCGDVVQHIDLAQSTVSQHLKVLVDAGLVRFEPDRQRSRYEIEGAALAGLCDSLRLFVDACCPAQGAAPALERGSMDRG